MNFSSYKEFLISQCANCSRFLTSETIKLASINLNCTNILSGNNNSSEISNTEAVSYVYGLSKQDLTEKLKSYFNDCEQENHLSDSDFSGLLESTILMLCENCSPVFEELFEISKQFRNLSDKNSLLSKILEAKGFEANLDENYIKDEQEDSNVDPVLANEEDLLSLEHWNEFENSNSNSENECEDSEDIKPENDEVEENKSDNDFSYESDKNGRNTEDIASSDSIKRRLRKRKQDLRNVNCITSTGVHKVNHNDRGNDVNSVALNEDFSDGNYSPHVSEASENSDLEYSQDIGKGKRRKTKGYDRRNAKKNVLRGHYVRVLCKEESTSTKKKYKFHCRECPGIFDNQQQSYRHYYLNHFKATSFHSERIPGPPFKCPQPGCESNYNGYFDLQRHCARWHLLKLVERSKSVRQVFNWNTSDTNKFDLNDASKNNRNEKATSEENDEESNLQPLTRNSSEHNNFSGSSSGVLDHRNLKFSQSSIRRKEKRTKTKNRMKNVLTGHYVKILCKETSTPTKEMYKYQCKECSEIFNSRLQVYRHYFLKHFKGTSIHSEVIPGPPFKCPHSGCNSSYMKYLDLQHHCARWHHLKLVDTGKVKVVRRLLKCEKCDLSFDTSHGFLCHQKRKHRIKYFMCPICGDVFPNQSDMKYHRIAEHGPVTNDDAEESESKSKDDENSNAPTSTPIEYCEELYFCRTCNYKFKARSALSIHLRKHHHHAIQKYDCKNCDHSFEYLSTFLNHLSENHQEFVKPEEYIDLYKCTAPDCSNSMYRREKFMKHQRVTQHSAFTVMCAFCEETFTELEKLNSHKLTNHKNKNNQLRTPKLCFVEKYTCRFCSQTFRSKKEELDHRSSHPIEEQIYKCEECNLTYTDYKQWSNHYIGMHRDVSKNLQCETCGRKYKGLRAFRLHCRLHAERATGIRPICEICGRSYNNSHVLLKHKNIMHDRRQQKKCHLCDHVSQTAYNLRLHLKVHEKNGIFRKRKNVDASV